MSQVTMSEESAYRKLEPIHAVQICTLFDQGHSIRQLAKLFNVSQKTVMRITMGYKFGKATNRTVKMTRQRNKLFGRSTSWPILSPRQSSIEVEAA